MKSLPEISVDTQIIIKRLRQMAFGEVVSYQELTGLIRRDVQYAARGCLNTACEVIRREDQIVIDVVRKVGVKRLANNEINSVGYRAVDSIRRKSNRTLKKCACADYSKLTQAERTRLDTVTGVMGALSIVTKPRQMERVEAAATQKREKLSFAETLALYGVG